MKNLIGQTLGDYRIESVAGRGGMGVVYRARQISLNRTVALKVLAPHLAENPAYIERLKREATAAAALSHQNIVHVYAASTTDDLHYFVMEYVEGETLHDRLAREGPMPPDEALATCVYLAQALDYAWKKAQIIHRDLKPGNVFISTDGEVKLGDLGLAKSVSEDGASMTQSGQTVGTAYYMSPEQARGERGLDFRSDIYSLGCTLYQMLTGRYPYEGTFGAVIAKQITEPPPAILQVLPTCPMPVVLLLNKMLAKHPSARHQSYDELIEDLRRAYEKITTVARHSNVERTGDATRQPRTLSTLECRATGSYIKKPAVLYAAMTTATIIVLAGVLVWAPWKTERAPSGVERVERSAAEQQQPLNREDAKARSVPVTQALLSAAAESPKEEPKPASKAPPLLVSRLQPATPEQTPPKGGTPTPVSKAPAENVGGASAPRPAAAQAQATASRGAEAPPRFQPPVAERASVQQSVPSPADGTLARSATNAAVIQVAQATPQTAPPPPTPAAQPSAPQPADDAFIKSVSAMPPEQQVQAVVAKLKELNPNFDGKETHKIEGGAVTMLGLSTVGVTDISPVKALRWLRTLVIAPPTLNQKGSVENLAPLQGMQLTWLWCHNNPITDLSPLKGMPLTTLSVGGTQVAELSPLTGMKLQVLSFNDTVVSELGPLEGMPLTVLWCNNTKVADVTPLKAMPLREIKCDFVAERDAAVLRSIRTLAKINDLPVAAFWARVGPVAAIATAAANVGGTSAFRPTAVTPPQLTMPTSAPSGLPAKKQIEQFVAKMKELNPGFDGNVEHKVEGGKLVEVSFSTERVSDISPLRELKTLKRLRCPGYLGTDGWKQPKGKLTDLSPLQGLMLTELDIANSLVRDVTSLRDEAVTSEDGRN